MQNDQPQWLTDSNSQDTPFHKIKLQFSKMLTQHSPTTHTNYYDFLLVAKQIGFRFEESTHLMAVKRFFAKNNNSILIAKLANLLRVSRQSLKLQKDKIIVKFMVPKIYYSNATQTIDQEQQNAKSQQEEPLNTLGLQSAGKNHILHTDHQNYDELQEQNQETSDKITIILSIKLQQMEKKISMLTNEYYTRNIFGIFDGEDKNCLNFQQFRHKIGLIVVESKGKVKVSEDDIRAIFFILDKHGVGYILPEDLQALKDVNGINDKMKNFYYQRINRDMVKNTLFKLGKAKNSSIQIFQVKNASLLEFKRIQQSIIDSLEKKTRLRELKQKKRLPHFGPNKGTSQNRRLKTERQQSNLNRCHSLGPAYGNLDELAKQRARIQKILRSSKQEKTKKRSHDTVTNKLRSLFIHKVILPRERMLENQKSKHRRNKTQMTQLSIQPIK